MGTPKGEKGTRQIGGLVSADVPEDKANVVQEEETVQVQVNVDEAKTPSATPASPKHLEKKRRSDPLEPSAVDTVEPLVQPAFEKFADLLAGPVAPRFALPERLDLLRRIQAALESVLQLAGDRDQPAVFHRIKKAAENIIGRNITTEHIGQILHLAVTPLVIRPTHIIHQGKRTASFTLGFPGKLGQAELLDRREKFRAALVDWVRVQHDKYLETIGVRLPSGARLRSWHPKFDPETTPDIPISDVLGSSDIAAVPTHVPSQIEEAVRTSAPTTPTRAETVYSEQPSKPMSLLERIKAKERQSQVAEIIASPAKHNATPDHAVLAEMVDRLAFLFASAGKSSLLLGDITQRLTAASKAPVSPQDVIQRISRLAVLVPEWVQQTKTGAVHIVKITKAMPIRDAQALLLSRCNS